MEEQNNTYPRRLSEKEWSLLEWILPDDRSGYQKYRTLLKSLQVIGQGRWGKGDIILGKPGDKPELTGPMERVYANGVMETDAGKLTISVHEYVAGQLEVQITNLHDEEIPDDITIHKKATYSTWMPGFSCPFCSNPVREITVNSDTPVAVLAICTNDKVIWIYDESDGVNHPIPATNFYNELMLYKKIKDPAVALHSKNLFSMLDNHKDEELREAFIRYNKTWHRITIKYDDRKDESGKNKITDTLKSMLKGKK